MSYLNASRHLMPASTRDQHAVYSCVDAPTGGGGGREPTENELSSQRKARDEKHAAATQDTHQVACEDTPVMPESKRSKTRGWETWKANGRIVVGRV